MENRFFYFDNGNKIPLLGLGTYSGENFIQIIESAIMAGYRLFDTASIYENESKLGEAFHHVISKGLVKREELFVTSKYWNDVNVSPTESLTKTLKDLQFDYIDNYLIHWPYGSFIDNKHFQRPCHEIWKELESLVDAGKIKNLGVSNFNTQLILDLLSYAKHKPVINQIELHPYLQQKEFTSFLLSQGILPQAWNPFSKGIYPFVPQIESNLFNEQILKDLSEKYKKTIAQIILKFEISIGLGVIPKTSNIERLAENIGVFDFELELIDIEKIRTLNKNLRFLDFKHSERVNFIPIFD